MSILLRVEQNCHQKQNCHIFIIQLQLVLQPEIIISRQKRNCHRPICILICRNSKLLVESGLRFIPMGIKAIPIHIQGDSHSFPFPFPIVSSISIPMGFPMGMEIHVNTCLCLFGNRKNSRIHCRISVVQKHYS